MSRRYDRRELAAAALGFLALPRAAEAANEPPAEVTELDAAPARIWAERALAAVRRPGRVFFPLDGGAWCDLGAAGRLEVTLEGGGAVLVTLRRGQDELEILRTLDDPAVARIETRLLRPDPATAGDPGFDTVRRVPGGYELTFSSGLALRHAGPRRLAAGPPAVYRHLAAAAVNGARDLVC